MLERFLFLSISTPTAFTYLPRVTAYRLVHTQLHHHHGSNCALRPSRSGTIHLDQIRDIPNKYQGYHNLSQDNHHLHDPRLTELGEQQCAALQSAFPYSDNLEVIIASPLKRTIYTALLSFAPAIKSRGIKVIALPEVSETSDLPCDTGSDLADLEKEFGSGEWAGVVDLSLCYEGWNVKTGKFAPSASAISGRAKEARLFLKERSEKELALVTHGGFLHYFTQDWSDSSLYLGELLILIFPQWARMACH